MFNVEVESCWRLNTRLRISNNYYSWKKLKEFSRTQLTTWFDLCGACPSEIQRPISPRKNLTPKKPPWRTCFKLHLNWCDNLLGIYCTWWIQQSKYHYVRNEVLAHAYTWGPWVIWVTGWRKGRSNMSNQLSSTIRPKMQQQYPKMMKNSAILSAVKI